MQLGTAIRQRIINLIIEQDINVHTLANRAGITPSTLNSFMSGKSNDPKSSTVLHICEAFNLRLCEFYDDSLFDEVMAEKETDEINIK